MHQGFPITIQFDSTLNIPSPIAAIASKTEMWINFAALKNGWYADESCVLSFEFILVNNARLEQIITKHSNAQWQTSPTHFTYLHQKEKTQVEAYLAVNAKTTAQFESQLKQYISEVCNNVVVEYGFVGV